MEEAGPPPEGEAKEEGGAVKAPAGKGQKRSRRPSDLFLPIAIIGRLMKEPLPDEMKVTKRAKLCVQECATEFIMFLMSEAADICNESDRHRVTGNDVIEAMLRLGLDDYHDVLAPFLAKLSQTVRAAKTVKKRKLSALGALVPRTAPNASASAADADEAVAAAADGDVSSSSSSAEEAEAARLVIACIDESAMLKASTTEHMAAAVYGNAPFDPAMGSSSSSSSSSHHAR